MTEAESKKHKRTLVGVVVSTKMEKSVVVQTERLVRHKLYGKFMRRHDKYMVDDPENMRALRLLARAHAFSGHREDALGLYRALAESVPDDAALFAPGRFASGAAC